MTTKEKLKKEIDQLNDDVIEEIYRIINTMKDKKKRKRRIHTHRLRGIYDNTNVRAEAYE